MKKIEDYLRDLEVKIESYLRKMGVGEKKISFYVEIILKTIAVVAIVVIFFILLQLAVFYGIFAWIGMKISVLTGLDAFLTKGIAFVLMAILFGTPLSSYVWSFLPLPSKNKEKRKERKKKRAIFLIFLAVLSFASYFASKNVYFNPRTGEAEKYYSVGIDGEYVFYSSPGYDPITGDKLLPVDRSVMEGYRNSSVSGAREGQIGLDENRVIGGIGNKAFFYPITFKNDSYRNLHLFISDGSVPSEGISSRMIGSQKSITLSLAEGIHFFVLTDVNGNIHGSREGGTLLSSSYEEFIFSLNDRSISSYNPFRFEVANLDRQIITIDKNCSVLHNQDLNKEEAERKKRIKDTMTSILFVVIGIFVMFLFYSSTHH